jgi:hypothetical protein
MKRLLSLYLLALLTTFVQGDVLGQKRDKKLEKEIRALMQVSMGM